MPWQGEFRRPDHAAARFFSSFVCLFFFLCSPLLLIFIFRFLLFLLLFFDYFSFPLSYFS